MLLSKELQRFIRQDKIISKCQNCKFEEKRGPATSNFIRELLNKKGLSGNKYNHIRGIRGKIAHGAGKRDIKFTQELIEFIPILESTALETVSLYTGLKIKSTTNAHTSQKFWKIEGVKIKERNGDIPSIFSILSHGYSCKAVFTKTNTNLEAEELANVYEGFLTPEVRNSEFLNIHPESWPD